MSIELVMVPLNGAFVILTNIININVNINHTVNWSGFVAIRNACICGAISLGNGGRRNANYYRKTAVGNPIWFFKQFFLVRCTV